MKSLLPSLFVISLALPLPAAEPAKSKAARPPCCHAEVPAGKPLADNSLYHLESTWTSDVGRKTRLRVLRGKPQVLAMFFTKCEWACPLLLHDLKRIEAALPDKLRDEVGFLLVSFDTKHDTPEVLHAYRETHRLSPARWTLFRGRPDDIRELAALVGVNYRETARGQFAHSNLLTVLNAEGEIAHQVTGLKQSIKEPVRILKDLLKPAGEAPRAEPEEAAGK